MAGCFSRSEADMKGVSSDVRFTTQKADICAANRNVRFVPIADSCVAAKKSGRAAPMISFVYLSAKCLFHELYGINCRPKFDTKLLDRFFHRRWQVSPPANNLRHRFLDSSQHVLYCNFTIG